MRSKQLLSIPLSPTQPSPNSSLLTDLQEHWSSLWSQTFFHYTVYSKKIGRYLSCLPLYPKHLGSYVGHSRQSTDIKNHESNELSEWSCNLLGSHSPQVVKPSRGPKSAWCQSPSFNPRCLVRGAISLWGSWRSRMMVCIYFSLDTSVYIRQTLTYSQMYTRHFSLFVCMWSVRLSWPRWGGWEMKGFKKFTVLQPLPV